MSGVRCRIRLPSPESSGIGDRIDPETGEVIEMALDRLKRIAVECPDLRPCPKHKGSKGTWNWIERKACNRCENAVRDE